MYNYRALDAAVLDVHLGRGETVYPVADRLDRSGVPYLFEFDQSLTLKGDRFLGDPEEIRKLQEAVAKQGSKK